MNSQKIRDFLKDAKNQLKSCKKSKSFQTILATMLSADYAVLLSPFNHEISILNLNNQGFTTDGEEWVSGALGNMRMTKIPIYLVSNEQMQEAKRLINYALQSNFIRHEMAGKHLYKFLKIFAKRYDY